MSEKRKTRAQRRADRRNSIKEAAISVFSEKGYHGAKVSDIVERVGVAQGTFYLYYESKQQIFSQVIHDFLELVLTTIASWEPGAIETRENLRDELERVGMALTEVVVAHEELTTIWFRESLAVDPELEETIDDFYDTLTAMLTDFNRILCTRGVIESMNFHLLAIMTIGMVERAIYAFVVQGRIDELPHHEVVDHLIMHYLYGTSAPVDTISE
jgi:AcrR family transcriptional regulator